MKIVISLDGNDYEVNGIIEMFECKKGLKQKKTFEDIEKKSVQKEKEKDKKVK